MAPEIQVNDRHDSSCESYCSHSYSEWLATRAPDVLWFDVQAVGSYQGSVYAVGVMKQQIVVFEGYYGSCSGCGAWGEGGEPESQEGILANSKLFDTVAEALVYVSTLNNSWYGSPDQEAMAVAITEIDKEILS
jgi:hypothetical protein